MRRLEGKVAVITGGAQGIGKATAEKFASEGASLAIWDLNEQKGRALVEEMERKNVRARFQSVNVADYESVERAAKEALAEFGKIDILINNAGVTRDASFLKMTREQWQQVIDVNLTGVFNCAKAIAPLMVERKYGRIVNASSVVGVYGNFGQTNYVASKAGVIGMTQVWARELGRKGITVNAVAPGFIATEMIQTIPEKILEAIKEKTPLQRFGTPEDVANVYCFLASDEAAFINGAVISVDGGYIPA
ncbi:MAG: 3-oxoacyl-ACP reductase FabG [Chloroherpetonaceae bacterium]|nr:3-oxoacyl-ACP reductase FabG [Chloroherpetonaceae bacterium]MDW8437809.1 3-oxoacyl-ACP reductase FabG [Chloroherpetonaceae bacterium]